MKKRKIELDILRIVACLMVFMLHTTLFSDQLVDFSQVGRKACLLYTPAWGGVWLFFLLSAYFSGAVFFENDDTYTWKNILKFYLSKFIKIGIPTYFYCFLLIVTNYTTYYRNKTIMLQILTFTYNGAEGVDGIGALWFVSTLMQLVLLTPLLCYLLHRLDQKIEKPLLWKLIIGALVLAGLAYRIKILNTEYPWYEWVYTFSPANLDIYICGLLCNILCKQKQKESSIAIKGLVSMLMLLVIGSNTYIYYLGNTGNLRMIFAYQNVYPSFYILAFLFFVVGFHSNNPAKSREGAQQRPNSIPLLLSKLSGYTFQFYLWHSFILHQIYALIKVTNPFATHIRLLFYTGVISFILSVFFENAFCLISKPYLQKIKEL